MQMKVTLSHRSFYPFFLIHASNVAFSRGTGWRGLCPAQTVTDRIVGYNAWFDRLCLLQSLGNPYLDDRLPCDTESLCLFVQ
jgi:hypothetical protein